LRIGGDVKEVRRPSHEGTDQGGKGASGGPPQESQKSLSLEDLRLLEEIKAAVSRGKVLDSGRGGGPLQGKWSPLLLKKESLTSASIEGSAVRRGGKLPRERKGARGAVGKEERPSLQGKERVSPVRQESDFSSTRKEGDSSRGKRSLSTGGKRGWFAEARLYSLLTG